MRAAVTSSTWMVGAAWPVVTNGTAFGISRTRSSGPVSISAFFFRRYGVHRDLHSFPTRRSSDLGVRIVLQIALEVLLGLVELLGLFVRDGHVEEKCRERLLVVSLQELRGCGVVLAPDEEGLRQIGRAHV